MQEIMYTKGYEGLKAELRAELSKSVNSFVRIGYLLKVARDTNVLSESNYSNMEEFAYAEFKIDKGTASKFMAINDRFSEGGNSDRLRGEYEGIGWSKLSMMLTLPDEINEEISDDFTKAEIQTIKDEVAEANKVTPLETMLEPETPVTSGTEDVLQKAIRQLGESNPQMYVQMRKETYEKGRNSTDIETMKSIMAPSGEMIYSIRIAGVGRMMLSLKTSEETVALINERSGEKEKRIWSDVLMAWFQMFNVLAQSAEADWSEFYGKPYPEEKAEVAPVQPKKETKVVKVNEVKTDTKPQKTAENDNLRTEIAEKPQNETANVQFGTQTQLHDTDPEIPEVIETVTVEVPAPEEEPVAAVEEQLPGQISVEELTPSVMPKAHVTREEYKRHSDTYRNCLKEQRRQLDNALDVSDWNKAKQAATDIIYFLDHLTELDEMEIVDEVLEESEMREVTDEDIH